MYGQMIAFIKPFTHARLHKVIDVNYNIYNIYYNIQENVNNKDRFNNNKYSKL